MIIITGVGVRRERTKRGHLDDLGPPMHMGQTKPPTDQTAIAEQRLDLIGRGVGGHVKVLGLAAQRQIAYAAAHQVGAIPGVFQPIENAQRLVTDLCPRDHMLVAGDDGGVDPPGLRDSHGLNSASCA